jgi:DNA-binding PadR family transcriptional regulator
MDYKVNNAEFTLLLLIVEHEHVNGYQLRQAVIQRGMEAWAGVGASSIYVMLKKLEKRHLVSSQQDTGKSTKGARGKLYSAVPEGKTILLDAIRQGLSQCREHDPRFNIALSGLQNLSLREVSKCLQERNVFLTGELTRLGTTEQSQDALPLPARLLFDHIKFGINSEIDWLKKAVSQLPNEDF